jgi:glycosyltransferase involved in cell wall biosynthesis
MKKIVIVSSYDVSSPIAWSGVPYFVARALRRYFDDISVISPLNFHSIASTHQKVRQYASRGEWYMPNRDADLFLKWGQYVSSELRRHRDAGVILTFHPPDVAYVHADTPIAIIHDATWSQFAADYPSLLNRSLAPETQRDALQLEQLAFEKASWIITFTEWAAASVARIYPTRSSAVRVVPPGAGVVDIPTRERSAINSDRRDLQQPVLLFIGRDGYRKGADIALSTHFTLRRLGIISTLLLIGLDNESRAAALHQIDHEGGSHKGSVHLYPFLSKGSPQDRSLMFELYDRSVLNLVPSRADCSSLAICDACAFAVPTVGARVGGNSELIHHATSGLLLPPTATAGDYASAIRSLLASKELYKSVSAGARARFDDTLNWDTSVSKICDIIDHGLS